MALKPAHPRPLSPHLGVYKWGPHMLVSILHRATGDGMATIGTGLIVWWLAALSGGPASYAAFQDVFTYESGGLNILGYVFGVGLTMSFFQHMMSGIRHLVLDTGAGYELKGNKTWAMLTMVASITLSVLFWVYIIGGKAHG